MPFTPYHFGPGLLCKGIVPRYFSLTAFVITQVVIDIEALYYMVRHEWPIHRLFHTILGGAGVGLIVGLMAYGLGKAFLKYLPHRLTADLRSEATLAGGLLGGAIGGGSHSLLDSLMHGDVRPIYPIGDGNPFLGSVGPGALHLGCVLAGLAGLAILLGRFWKTRASG